MLEGDDHRLGDVMNNFAATTSFYLMPSGWFYQNRIMLAQPDEAMELYLPVDGCESANNFAGKDVGKPMKPSNRDQQ